MNRTNDLWMILSIVGIACTRMLPHWPNFTPVLAVALCGGYLFTSRGSVLVPLAAMIVSDIFMGLVFGREYALHAAQPYVYACVVATALLGRGLSTLSGSKALIVGGVASGAGFFLVTNAAVWIHGTMYPHTIEGLVACYAAGLAFYRDSGNFLLNGIVSTWVFGGLIFAVRTFVDGRLARQTV